MASRGLSGEDLAELTGLSQATVSRATTGKPISAKTVRRLAEVLSRMRPSHLAAELAGDITLEALRQDDERKRGGMAESGRRRLP